MRKLYLIVIAAILIPFLSFSQLQSISLQNFQACNGATLVANPIWEASVNPMTLNFERQIAGGDWSIVVSKVYDWQDNYITIGVNDISAATNFRVRAVDMVTLQERISNGAAVNPATWGGDRGTAFVTASSHWGTVCGNTDNYIQVATNTTVNGRPPFRVEYKLPADANYTVGPTFSAGTLIIGGIVPGTQYQIRVTDFCGKVSNLFSNALQVLSGATIVTNATTCNNGRVRVDPSGGIAPYTYGISKQVTGTPLLAPTVFDSTGNVFNNLGPGDYYFRARDNCGNMSAPFFVRLGAGFPYIQNFTAATPPDSCTRSITVLPFQGQPPLEYGIRYIFDANFSWQSSPVFDSLYRTGAYFFRTRDACGQVSDSLSRTIIIPAPQIDSAVRLSTNCIKDIKVHASGGYQPYSYGIRLYGTTSFVYQSSDTFKNIGPGQHFVVVRDRCGRQTAQFLLNELIPGCNLRVDVGDFESQSTVGCQDYSGSDWIDVHDDQGSLIFSINPQNNLIPQTCWGIRVSSLIVDSLRSATVNGHTAYFFPRNFYIEPAAGLTLTGPVLLRLYVTLDEMSYMLALLRTSGFPNATIDDLRILKKKGSPGSPVDLEVINEGAASAGELSVIKPTITPYLFDYMIEFPVTDFSEFNPFSGEQGALPLTLVNFTGNTNDNKVMLGWTTTDEVNTDRFEIQWSVTGSDFRHIGTIASNNRPGNNKYSFNHNNPGKGLNYYRLKQIDKDGKFTFSATIKVTVDNLSGLTVYPNPVHDKLVVSVPSARVIRAISITDAAGRLQLRMGNTNTTAVIVPVQKLSKGIYWLQVVTNDKTYRMKFIKH